MPFFVIGVFQVKVAKPHVLEPPMGGYEQVCTKFLMIHILPEGASGNAYHTPPLGAPC